MSGALRNVRFFLMVTMIATLAACGGGGSGSPISDDDDDDTTGSGSAASFSEPATSDGTSITDLTVDFSQARTVSFVVRDSDGDPVADETIDVELSIDDGEVGKTSEKVTIVLSTQVTSDADGVAEVTLLINDPTLTGTATLTLSDGENTFSTSYVFTVTSAVGIPALITLELTHPDTGAVITTVSPTTDAILTTTVTDAFGTPVSGQTVEFSDDENALVDFSSSSITDDDGAIVLDIDVLTPSATDPLAVDITASVDVDLADDSDVVTISDELSFLINPNAGGGDPDAIDLVSVSNSVLSVSASGATSSAQTAEVLFEVVDDDDIALEGIAVNFSLSTGLGGIALSDTTLLTDSSGQVSVELYSGTVATSVEVIATVDGTTIETVSSSISIQAGSPDQDSFSLSIANLNPGGGDTDGLTNTVTVRMADSFNNLVSDGTNVQFLTEYGSIPSNCSTTDGACSVDWISQNPRAPLLDSTPSVKTLNNTSCTKIDADSGLEVTTTGIPCSDSLGQVYGGRNTILAFATGNESFIDANGNGLYDSGESFEDLPEAFVDHNEDGVFGGVGTIGACTAVDAGNCASWETGGQEETWQDANANGQYDWGDGIYNGSACSDTAAAAGDCTTESVDVFESIRMLASGNEPYMGLHNADDEYYSNRVVDVSSGFDTFYVYLSDKYNGLLPGNTTISVESDNCEVLQPTSELVVADANRTGFTSIPLTLGPDSDDTASGLVTVSITVPTDRGGSGNTDLFTLACVDIATDTGDTGGVTTDAAIGLSLTDSLGATTTLVTNESEGTLTVTLTTEDGLEVLDQELVQITTTIGELSPTSGLILTDENGVATISVLAADDEGAGTLTATYGTISADYNFQIEQVDTGVATGNTIGIEMVNSVTSNTTRSISDVEPGSITLTLLDADGAPLANQLVTIETDTGSLSPASGSQILTDALGENTSEISLSPGDAVVGSAGTFSATYTDPDTDEVTTATFTFEVIASGTVAGEPAAISLRMEDEAGNSITSINSATPGVVIATVTDVNSDPVANQIVNISSDLGTLSPASGNVLTNASGEADISLSVGEAQAGEAGLITATLDDLQDQLTFQIAEEGAVSGEPVALGLSLSDEFGNTTSSVSDDNDATFTITVTDGLGAPVVDQILYVETTLGALAPSSGIIVTGSATSATPGVATIVLTANGAEVGEAGTLTVETDTGSLSDSVNFSISASAVVAQEYNVGLVLNASGGGATTSISSADSGTLVITLTDSDANPVTSGEIIAVTTTLGALSPASGNVLTNASGQAELSVLVGEGEVGEGGTITATYTDPDTAIAYTGTIQFQIVSAGATAGEPANIDLFLQDPDNPGVEITSVSATDPGQLLVTITDSIGTPLAGRLVNVTSTITNAVSPASGNVLTDTNGVARVSVGVGDGDAGEGGALTATLDELNATQNYEVVNSGTTSTSGFVIRSRLYSADVDLSSLDATNLTTTNEVSTVNSVESGVFVIGLVNASDAPIEGALVEVATTLGEFSAFAGQSGNILTDANGIASAVIGAGDDLAGAAGTLTASVEDVETSVNFAIGSVTLQLGRDSDDDYTSVDNFVSGEISITNTSLSPTGSTALTVVVVDSSGDVFTTPLTVNFTSSCVNTGDAVIDTGISTVNGVASATYEATGCAGSDTIVASIEELSGVTASGSITVAEAQANSIQFVSAEPTNIALKGTGGNGRQEFSTLTFQVIDESGSPIAGELVSLDLTTVLGGIELTGDLDGDGDLDNSDPDPANDERLTSNASGNVTVVVNAGTVPTSIRVRASIVVDGTTITTVSDSLVVSTGLPDNDSFSLSASILNVGGFNVDGLTSTLTLRAADAFNNPVPDGTTILFTTEYGSITATCTTEDGACSVEWTSQDPRTPLQSGTGRVLNIGAIACDSNSDGTPDLDSQGFTVSTGLPCPTLSVSDADVAALTGSGVTSVLTDPLDTDYPGQVFGGRSRVIAVALGEEGFVDANGNGIYDWVDTDGDGCYEDGVNQYDADGDASDCNGTLGTEQLESFEDLTDAFIDHNEDGVFGNAFTEGGCTAVGVGTNMPNDIVDINDIDGDGDTSELLGQAELCAGWQEGGVEEEIVDIGTDTVFTYGNGIYNGLLCSEVLEVSGFCSKELINVRDSVTLLVGGSDPYIGAYDTANVLQNAADVSVDVTGGTQTRTIYVSDIFNARPPAGTTISVSSDNCKILSATSYEIGDSSAYGNFAFSISLTEDDTSDGVTFGSVLYTVNPPDRVAGQSITGSFGCTDAD